MIGLFYKTRNIIGLILVITPIITFISSVPTDSITLYTFLASAIGIIAASVCYRKLPFKLWTCFFCSFFILSAAFSIYNSYYYLILSATGTGLIFVLPSNIIPSWFRLSKNRVFSIVWTVSVILGFACRTFAERYANATILIALFAMISGVLLFIEKPFFDETHYSFLTVPPYFNEKFFGVTKAFIFIFFISFVAAFSYASLSTSTSTMHESLQSASHREIILLVGLITGILTASFQAEKKGIYSCFISLIFAAQALTFLSCFENNIIKSEYISLFLCSAVFSSFFIIIPLMSYYLCWSCCYCLWSSAISTAAPLGIAVSLPAHTLVAENLIRADIFISLLMTMLVLGFFLVFSAWKHRFTLLR